MFCTVNTGGLRGLASFMASVEVDVSRGLPGFEMVGLLGSEVKEARERIRVALKNAQIDIPSVRVTVNISPADIHKAGTVYDLPVALGIMAAWGLLPAECLDKLWVAGELGLQGEVKPVRGILPMVMEACHAGMTECLLPFENLKEGMVASKLPVMGVRNIQEAISYLQASWQEREILRQQAQQLAEGTAAENTGAPEWDFAMVRQMKEAKRAALIAAAGFHNLLLTGPPGTGKTLLARCIPSILPPLDIGEQREVSAIYSVAGKLEQGNLVTVRPFVSPHHTVSVYALTGGGNVPRPGLVSLAHKGVLFLDEMAEFKRATLDILRQPLEERKIHLAKSGGNFVYPADFMLVGATNPCPCGHYPDRNRCRCTSYEVHRYLSRLSGPLMDRMDLCAYLQGTPAGILWEEAGAEEKEEDSRSLLEKVLQAKERQTYRYKGTQISVNSRMGPRDTIRFCKIGFSEQQYLERIAEKMHLSVRACHRILRVARTVADLENSECITALHLSEAVCYRRNENAFGEVH